ncbi:MAG: hypothetical protein ACREI3_07995, partial [Nitrospirales bacterium]
VWGIGTPSPVAAQSTGKDGHMTDEDAVAIGEQFGLIIGEVDKEIQEILGLTRAQGVVVFEVIGGSQADRAGIKVKAVIKEIDKMEIRNLQDFGLAMKQVLDSCNYTIGTYEPADAENQGVGGIMNFHFVPCATD